jgi:RNA polymerase sporulation-specific sigma factor
LPGFLSTIALLIKELTLLVSYVRNNAFPQPLSEQEESRYLGMMAEGDAKARNLLIEHNLRLVAHIVKRLWTRYDVNMYILFSRTFTLMKVLCYVLK